MFTRFDIVLVLMAALKTEFIRQKIQLIKLKLLFFFKAIKVLLAVDGVVTGLACQCDVFCSVNTETSLGAANI